MKILIADHDDQSRRALQEFLLQQGHDVVVAATGDEVWQALLGEVTPAMAVLCWKMPGLNVTDVCRKARASSKLKSLFVILLVPQENSKGILEGLVAGANDYVRKPLRHRRTAGPRLRGRSNGAAANRVGQASG